MPAAPPEPALVDPPVASAPPDEPEPLGEEPEDPGVAPGLVVPPVGGDAAGECEVPEPMPVPVDGAVPGVLEPAPVLPGDDVSAPPVVDVPSPDGVCSRSRSLVDPLGACAKTGVEANVSTTRTLSHFFIYCLLGVCAPCTASEEAMVMPTIGSIERGRRSLHCLPRRCRYAEPLRPPRLRHERGPPLTLGDVDADDWLMFSTAPRLPLDLGQPVRRRRDATKAIGYVVGLLFLPSGQTLVRWQDGTATFEAPKDLVKVMRAA